MSIEDDNDLDEYDADVFLHDRLTPVFFRRDWSRKHISSASKKHDRAQLLTLCNSYSTSSLPRFREQFAYACRLPIDDLERRLLTGFISGHAMDLLALARERLVKMYLASHEVHAASKGITDLATETGKSDLITALLEGEAGAESDTVTIHDARGVAPGKTGSDKDMRDAMRVALASPKRLPGPKNDTEVDELAAEIYAMTPWMPEVADFVRSSMLDSLEERGTASIAPMLLVGPHGCGKTHIAENIARLSRRPWKRLDGATMHSAFSVSGGDFLWRNSHPSDQVRMIAETGAANPILVFDEIEKATSSSGGDVRKALLPLLQRSTAATYHDPYLQAGIDLSFVCWILLANSLEGLTAPLLDRVQIFHVGYPQGEDLYRTVKRALANEAAGDEIIRAVVMEIESGNMSLRGIDRIRSRLRAVNRRPVLN